MDVPEPGHTDAHSCGTLQIEDSQLLPCSGSRPFGRPLHGLKEGLNLDKEQHDRYTVIWQICMLECESMSVNQHALHVSVECGHG